MVRVDRRGAAILEGAGDARDDGGLLLCDVGAGDDSFRRFDGGAFAVGDGVGNERTPEGGFDTTIDAGGVGAAIACTVGAGAGGGAAAVGAAAEAALPDLL